MDDLACAAGLHRGGTHSEGLCYSLIQAAWRTKTGFVDSVGDGELWLADLVAEALFALLASEVSGGDAEDALEAALQGELAQPCGGGEVVEPGALAGVLGQELGGLGDGCGLRILFRRRSLWLTTQARAEARGFGEGGGGEEADVLALGPAAGAAGAAVDFGGLYGVDELAVGGGIAREDLLPCAACEDGRSCLVVVVRHALDSCEGPTCGRYTSIVHCGKECCTPLVAVEVREHRPGPQLRRSGQLVLQENQVEVAAEFITNLAHVCCLLEAHVREKSK